MPEITPVDTRPYATLGGGEHINPFGALASLAHVQALSNQNALFQQTMRARQALGPLAQQSIGPDGNMDFNKFGLLVSTHPDTALLAPEIMNQIATRKLTDVQTQKAYMDLHVEKMRVIGVAALAQARKMSPADDNKPADASALTSMFAPLWPLEGPDGKPLIDRKGAIAKMTEALGEVKTNRELRQKLFQFGAASSTHADMAAAVQYDPTAGGTDAQNNPIGAWRNAQQGTITPVGGAIGAIQPGPSAAPSAVAQPSTGPGAGESAGATLAAGAPGAPSQPGAMQTGAPSAPPTQPAGSLPPGTTPGDFRKKQYESMGEYGDQLNTMSRSASNVKTYMEESRKLLNSFNPGRGTEFRMELARLARAGGAPESVVEKIMGGDVSSALAFEKLAVAGGTLWMSQINAGNAKVRSVQEWNRFQGVYPNIETERGAITKMYDFMNYMADMTIQEKKAFGSWIDAGKDPRKFIDFWNNVQQTASDKHFSSAQRQRSLAPSTPSVQNPGNELTPRRPLAPRPNPLSSDLGNL